MAWPAHVAQPHVKNATGQLVDDREGREAVSKIVGKGKADRVGTAIVDLPVCERPPALQRDPRRKTRRHAG